MLRTLATIAATGALVIGGGTAAANTMNATCSHSEGSYDAVIEFRANDYPTPDVLVHGPGFTVEFDHVRGSEQYRTTSGNIHSISGNNQLNFLSAAGQRMVCTYR